MGLDGPIAASYLVETDIAGGAASASTLCAVAAVPHVDFLLGLVLGALVGSFGADALCTERAGDFAYGGIPADERGKRQTVRVILAVQCRIEPFKDMLLRLFWRRLRAAFLVWYESKAKGSLFMVVRYGFLRTLSMDRRSWIKNKKGIK